MQSIMRDAMSSQSVVNADRPKQAAKCSTADGFAVSSLSEWILQLCDLHSLNSVNEVQRKEVRAGSHDAKMLLSTLTQKIDFCCLGSLVN